MIDPVPSAPPVKEEPSDHLFPVLTAGQIARVAPHGRQREVAPDEVLADAGDREPRFFVVMEGRVRIVRQSDARQEIVSTLLPGQFSGEINMLSGRRPLVRIQAVESGRILELDREHLLALVQTDSELGDVLMRAFILRRTEMIARGFGDVVLVGSSHSPGTLRIKEFLTRNGHPITYLDLDRDAEVQELLDRFEVSVEDIPVMICRGRTVLRNPTNAQIADCLGFNIAIDQTLVRDVVIVGGGPAGLAAAVAGASEGLDVLVVESNSPGGQAGSSSKIENYLGFPTGVSGLELAARAYTQAQKFGAQIIIANDAARLTCARTPYAIELDNGSRLPARAIIIATGAEYRKLPLENLARFEGAGVYYGATFVESQLCRGEEVIVVGGGNSAGQAAVFLSQIAKMVNVLVRADGLAATMSRYLIRRIEQSPNIVVRTRTEITALEGNGSLQRVEWRDGRDGRVESHPIGHVFTMAGAVPNTRWLQGCVALDARGFVKTGLDLTAEELATARWPLARPPHLLETSLPGVFAVGDVRSGNVKRVASAVGEGSIAISLIQQDTLAV